MIQSSDLIRIRNIAYNINAKYGRIPKTQKNKIRTEEETPAIKELHEEHDMEHSDAFQHIKENPQHHERDSHGVNPDVRIEDFMELIENKTEGEDKSKIQKTQHQRHSKAPSNE